MWFVFADGNAAGTGPSDPWTAGGGGVQPPYSGYAQPHLAQPAYPMHLPHDPMVRIFLLFFLKNEKIKFAKFLELKFRVPGLRITELTALTTLGTEYTSNDSRVRLYIHPNRWTLSSYEGVKKERKRERERVALLLRHFVFLVKCTRSLIYVFQGSVVNSHQPRALFNSL